MLGGEGVATCADDCAVVREEAEGTLKPLPGVECSELNEKSWFVPFDVDRSACVTSAADITEVFYANEAPGVRKPQRALSNSLHLSIPWK